MRSSICEELQVVRARGVSVSVCGSGMCVSMFGRRRHVATQSKRAYANMSADLSPLSPFSCFFFGGVGINHQLHTAAGIIFARGAIERTSDDASSAKEGTVPQDSDRKPAVKRYRNAYGIQNRCNNIPQVRLNDFPSARHSGVVENGAALRAFRRPLKNKNPALQKEGKLEVINQL